MIFLNNLILTSLITAFLKELIQLPIPSTFPPTTKSVGWSFPSGHASMSTFVFGWIHKKYRKWWSALLLFFGWWYFSFQSWYLGYHRFSEIVAGTLIGLAVLSIS